MFVLNLLVILLGLALTYLVVRGGLQKDRSGQITSVKPTPVVVAIVILAATIGLASSFGQVPAGSRGVVLRFDATTGEVKQPGFYMVMPFINKVAMVNVQIQAYKTEAIEAASADLQDVHTGVTVNYQIDPSQVVYVYTNFRGDVIDRILRPNVLESVKSSTAKFTAEQLITQRPAVKALADQTLASRVERFGLRIDATSITQFEFSRVFTEAIEAKVKAEQDALRERNRLLQVEYEAKQKIAAAEGEAKALALRRAQLNEEILRLEAIQRWDGHLPQYMGSGVVPFLNLAPASK